MRVVRFLRAKRYPHPNGPRRQVGTVMPIPAETASQWARAGVVEITDPMVTELDLGAMTVSELKKLASDLGVDLGKARKKDEIAAAIHAAVTQPRDAGQAGGEQDPPAPPAGGDKNPGAPTPPSTEDEGSAGLTD